MDFKITIFRCEDGYVGMGNEGAPEGATVLATVESDRERAAWSAARILWSEEARESTHHANIEQGEAGAFL